MKKLILLLFFFALLVVATTEANATRVIGGQAKPSIVPALTEVSNNVIIDGTMVAPYLTGSSIMANTNDAQMQSKETAQWQNTTNTGTMAGHVEVTAVPSVWPISNVNEFATGFAYTQNGPTTVCKKPMIESSSNWAANLTSITENGPIMVWKKPISGSNFDFPGTGFLYNV